MGVMSGERDVEGMGQQRVWQQVAVVLVLQAVFFALLFYGDNKYQTLPPYGRSGIIDLKEGDLERGKPIFLIDGWLLTDRSVKDRPTYIGEFSNLQRGNPRVSPHGKACYQLTLRYEGTPKMVAVDFWQLSSWYTVSVDGARLDEGVGNGWAAFLLTQGDHCLTVETLSRAGYYSGMYFPPGLGTVKTLMRARSVQSFAYGLAFLIPLALAVFTLFLWRTGGELSRWFGLLCCCYGFYMARYFVFLFSLPVAGYWFLAENLALYGLCFCVAQVTVAASGSILSRQWQWIRVAFFLIPLTLMILCVLIPVLPWAVLVHSRLTDVFYVFTFFCAVFFSVRGVRAKSWESRYTLAGCWVFGGGLLANLLFSNLFEPVYFFWQFEWCGLLLVLLFGAMMVSRSRRVLRENDALTNHLEEQVKRRTQEVRQLLDERKAFFSDMAHELKAPVFATQSFIDAIRKSGVGVDAELKGYLDQAEARQREMSRRLQGLSAINALDRIEGERVKVSLSEMLSEIYATYHGEAQVRAVHFFVEPLGEEAFFMAWPEKLSMLFENLIYNALRATPSNGMITVSARADVGKIIVTVEDTGCGIPEEELPFVFRRFYVGSNNRGTGTGLGLYIVHSIVTEMRGKIEVQSVVDKGTKFTMKLPRCG